VEDRAAEQRASSAAFAGGDQRYLGDIQYVDSTKLAARANLHVRYGRADWFPWWARQVPWPEPGRAGVRGRLSVLEAGGGVLVVTKDVGVFVCRPRR
jgi:hypothetical protein